MHTRSLANNSRSSRSALTTSSEYPSPSDEYFELNATPSWSSNLLFLIIAIGTEAGIANVWKFSYLAGANGGGLFFRLVFIAPLPVTKPEHLHGMIIRGHRGQKALEHLNTLGAPAGPIAFF